MSRVVLPAAFVGIAIIPVFGRVHAATVTLAEYTFTSSSQASAVDPANADALDFVRGPGFTGANGSVNTGAGNPAPAIQATLQNSDGITGNTKATAITNQDFFTFSLTVDPGYQARLETLSFETSLRKQGDNASNVQDTTLVLMSSIEGFGSGDASILTIPHTTTSSGTTSFDLRSIDLTTRTGYAAATGTVEFRFYLFDNGSNSNSAALRIDNVKLQGEIVPEPAALSLVGVAAAALRRRRRIA